MKRTALLLLLAVAAAAPAAEGQDPAAKPKQPISLEELMELAKEDASKIRGLPFLGDLPVRRITNDEFLEITLRDVERVFGSGDEMAGMEELLQLLRVIPADVGLLDLVKKFFPATVAAKYDPFRKEILFLRGFGSRSIMVHELIHALEDQHYNLKLLFETGEMTFDRLLALGALAEGDAENVQRIYDTKGFLALTPIEAIRKLAQTEIDRYLARMDDFPRTIARPFIFQYLDGLLFIETVKRARGGYKALDAVYRDPPTTTEQILHPERYLERDHPVEIRPPAPPDGYSVRVSNVLGQLGLGIVLAAHLGEAAAAAPAAGWDGDRIVLYRAEGRPPLLVWYTAFDTEADAAEFAAAAANMLAVRRPDAEVAESPGLAVQRTGEVVHAVRTAGRHVLFAEGIPAADFAGFLAGRMGAETREVRVHRGSFGAAASPQVESGK